MAGGSDGQQEVLVVRLAADRGVTKGSMICRHRRGQGRDRKAYLLSLNSLGLWIQRVVSVSMEVSRSLHSRAARITDLGPNQATLGKFPAQVSMMP